MLNKEKIKNRIEVIEIKLGYHYTGASKLSKEEADELAIELAVLTNLDKFSE